MTPFEREIWVRFVGPDPETDELYPLVCPECGEGIAEGEARWFMRVAFHRDCLPPEEKEKKQPEPSEALQRIRRHLHGIQTR